MTESTLREALEEAESAIRDACHATAIYGDQPPQLYLDALAKIRAALSPTANAEMVPGAESLRLFAVEIMECWPDGDVDGGFLQDTAIKHGLLAAHEVTEPCNPEGCHCAEYGDFPQTCYRQTAMLSATPDSQERRKEELVAALKKDIRGFISMLPQTEPGVPLYLPWAVSDFTLQALTLRGSP